MTRTILSEVDLRAAWEENAPAFIEWARRPGHDSYWRFHRDAFLRLVARRATVLGMTSREERLARNEALSRETNEELEFGPKAVSVPGRFMPMVCECGNTSCGLSITITVLEYERVRSDPVRFAVVRDHVIDDIEVVVEENDRFVVVAKREGEPAAVATAEDPRS